MTMSELNINENWNEKRDRLRKKYAELNDSDLEYVEGQEEELVTRIQQQLNTNKEETKHIIRNA